MSEVKIGLKVVMQMPCETIEVAERADKDKEPDEAKKAEAAVIFTAGPVKMFIVMKDHTVALELAEKLKGDDVKILFGLAHDIDNIQGALASLKDQLGGKPDQTIN